MTPRGFWSYSRGDDEHLDNRLSELREKVENEISTLLGRDIDMFQDVYAIRTGDDWQERLRDELTDASFMVPVLTPRYFQRPWCREEVMTYLRLAEEEGRKPLLFPIYFIEDRQLERGEFDAVRKAVSRYQFFDYRNLRFESDPTRLGKAVNAFATDVLDALEEATGERLSASPPPAQERSAANITAQGSEAKKEPARLRPGGAPRPVPELVVDPWPGRGDFLSIQEAIDAADPGGRVLVRPGRYGECLRLDKALELIGDGPRDEIVITTSAGIALTVSANVARITGLTIRREAGEGYDVALWVTAGRPEIEDCDVSSKSFASAEVVGPGTEPAFRRCRFRDGAESGLFFVDGARAVVEDCEINRNGISGVQISKGADPILRRCAIRDNKQGGMLVSLKGRGRIEECEIRDNHRAGVEVREGGAPVVRNCRILGNGYQAVWISDSEGGGTYEGNDLRGNAGGAWLVADGAEPALARRDNIDS